MKKYVIKTKKDQYIYISIPNMGIWGSTPHKEQAQTFTLEGAKEYIKERNTKENIPEKYEIEEV